MFNAPVEGFPWNVYGNITWAEKARMVGLPTHKKFDDIFSRLNAIHERDGRTDDTTTRLVARF